MTQLYTMRVRDRKTGEEKIIYGHVTVNVIHDYFEAYVTDEKDVIVSHYPRKDLNK